MTDYLESYRRMARAIRFVPPLARNQEYHRQIPDLVPPTVVINSVSKNILPDKAETPAPGPAPDPSEHIAALVRDAVSKPTVVSVTYAIPENIGDRISRMAPPKPLNQVVFAPKLPQPDPNWIAAQKVKSEHPASDKDTQVEESLNSAITSPSLVAQTPEILEEMPALETQESTVLETTPQVEETPDPAILETSTAALEAPPAEETPDRAELPNNSVTEAIAPVVAPETPSLEEIPSVEPTVESSTDTFDVEQTASLAAETPVLEETPSFVPEVEQSTETEPLPQLETPAPIELEQVSSPTEETETNEDSLRSSSPELTSSELSVQPNISDSEEETQLKCPACDSTELRKNGHRKDKQRYLCKDCGKQFVEPDTLATKTQPSSNKSAPKTAEANEITAVKGVGDRPTKSTSNPSKTTKKAKGFGTKKDKK